MNQYRNTNKDIHQRIYRYIIGCFRDVVKKIPKAAESLPVISQISSSLTSMGANDQEADAASSTKDFLAKYHTAKKETKETVYWLSFIGDAGLIDPTVVTPYIQEGTEILKIVSSIIENTKQGNNPTNLTNGK